MSWWYHHSHQHRSAASLGSALLVLLQLVLLPLSPSHALANSPLFPNRGTAAKPFDKRKIAVVGVGGYQGALTFGFLQRAASLYGTGVGAVRALGATADSATRLNRVLSRHFCLAFADENYIKLADLTDSPQAVAAKLDGWDALIMGTDVGISRRAVTPGTYEKTPNDKTWELYWPAPGNLLQASAEEQSQQETMLKKILQGAELAGVGHICLIDDARNDALVDTLKNMGTPSTVLRPCSELAVCPDYTYRTGVLEPIQVAPEKTASSNPPSPVYRENLAALAVQTLLSLDWTKSRCLQVTASDEKGATDEASDVAAGTRPKKRPDQEWCVNSVVLEKALAVGTDQYNL